MTLRTVTEYKFDLSTVRLERTIAGRLWLYTDSGYISGDEASWRELLRQLQEMLGDAPKVDAPKEEQPDPRGYVFVDEDGDAWGYSRNDPGASYVAPVRPFRTFADAESAGKASVYGMRRVEVWTPECGMPPMPEDAP